MLAHTSEVRCWDLWSGSRFLSLNSQKKWGDSDLNLILFGSAFTFYFVYNKDHYFLKSLKYRNTFWEFFSIFILWEWKINLCACVYACSITHNISSHWLYLKEIFLCITSWITCHRFKMMRSRHLGKHLIPCSVFPAYCIPLVSQLLVTSFNSTPSRCKMKSQS